MLTELLWGRGSAEWGGREATAQLERRKSQMGKLTGKAFAFDLWVGKIAWRREWQPIPVFSPGEFHGRRSLVGL